MAVQIDDNLHAHDLVSISVHADTIHHSYYYHATHPTIPLMHRTYVLLCLDERTACIFIYSSDVCAFS